MRDRLRDAYEAGKPVRVEFFNGEVREGILVEFRDLSSAGGPVGGFSAQVRFEGDSDLANVVFMKSVI